MKAYSTRLPDLDAPAGTSHKRLLLWVLRCFQDDCERQQNAHGCYDYDSGRGRIFVPAGGLEQGFFDGRPIVDLELSIPLGQGTTLTVGAQNALDTYSQVSVIANAVGEQYSEYTPWGFSGAYYYVRIGYDWGN